jgi:CBS domain containing-hemolysin-like protein
MTQLPFRLAILAVALCLSAFFSASETALFSLQPEELSRMAGAAGADGVIAALRSRPKRLLITILFCNMVVNVVFYGASYLLIREFEARLHTTGAFLLGVGSLLTVLIFGEVVPKNVAVTFCHPLARAAAVPLLLVQRALLPVVMPLEKVADAAASLVGGHGPAVRAEELQMLVNLGVGEGVVDESAAQMIAEVIGLSEVQVSEMMVPRVEIAAFDLRAPREGLLALFRRNRQNTVAVYDGDVDEMKGIVHVKDVFFSLSGEPLEHLVRAIPFLPETATVEEALRQCRQQKAQSAFVVDEYGTLAGLVTVEDLLEEIVGEISDEYDPERPGEVEPLDDGTYRVQGGTSLRTWQELSRAGLPDLDVGTVGGLVMALLDDVPEAGKRVRWGGFEYNVESVQGRRAGTILARRLSGAEALPEDRPCLTTRS